MAGLSYIFITFPALQLVITLSVNRLAKTNNQMTKSIVIISSFIGEHLVHIKDYACFINSWQKNIPLTFLPKSSLHQLYDAEMLKANYRHLCICVPDAPSPLLCPGTSLLPRPPCGCCHPHCQGVCNSDAQHLFFCSKRVLAYTKRYNTYRTRFVPLTISVLS